MVGGQRHALAALLPGKTRYLVSQLLWDRGPVNSFFNKTRARSQQIYS